jgi:ferric-dicitrate binding protein FerR (iron transport regulator)
MWAAIGAAAAVAAGGIGIYAVTRDGTSPTSTTNPLAAGQLGTVKTIDRAVKDKGAGLEVREGQSWRPLRVNDVVKAGAELRTDERTRAAVELADGSRFVLDHKTTFVFDDARRTKLTAGRVVADVVPVAGSPASIDTPAGRVDVVGTRFALTATAKLTVVQVVRASDAPTPGQGGGPPARA